MNYYHVFDPKGSSLGNLKVSNLVTFNHDVERWWKQSPKAIPAYSTFTNGRLVFTLVSTNPFTLKEGLWTAGGVCRETKQREQELCDKVQDEIHNGKEEALELQLYELASKEFDTKQAVAGLWAKVFADADGDESKARARYLKARVEQLRRGGIDEIAKAGREAESSDNPKPINKEFLRNASAARASQYTPSKVTNDYGLVENNPVRLQLITDSYSYLDSLATPDGFRIKYDRIGSFEVSGISNLVDKYNVKDFTGAKIYDLWIHAYSENPDPQPPQGLQWYEPEKHPLHAIFNELEKENSSFSKAMNEVAAKRTQNFEELRNLELQYRGQKRAGFGSLWANCWFWLSLISVGLGGLSQGDEGVIAGLVYSVMINPFKALALAGIIRLFSRKRGS